MDFVPVIVPLLQEMAFGSHAMEIVAGALMWLELNEWEAEMGVQKVLEPDGWVNPDMSHSAPLKQGLADAGSVCGAAGRGADQGEYPETDSPLGCAYLQPPLCGFSCHWLLCLQGQSPSPQAAPLSLLCCLGARKETAIFLEPRGEEGSS